MATASQSARRSARPARRAGRYVLKLRDELEVQAAALFAAPADRERIKSVLADLAKTSSDFRHIAGRALDHLSAGILPRLRCGARRRERAPASPLPAVHRLTCSAHAPGGGSAWSGRHARAGPRS